VDELPLKQYDIAISSDDRFLATSSNDHSAKIRNAETGKEFLGLWGMKMSFSAQPSPMKSGE
jgi:WD40 repeat protein